MSKKYRRIGSAFLTILIYFLPLILSPISVLAVNESSSETSQNVEEIEKNTSESSEKNSTSGNIEQKNQTTEMPSQSSEQKETQTENNELQENVVGPKLERTPRLWPGAITNVHITKKFPTEFLAKFVYPDGTLLNSSDLQVEGTVVKHTLVRASNAAITTDATEILKPVSSIPYIGNGTWKAQYETPSPLTFGVGIDGVSTENYKVYYDKVFIKPKASVKKISIKNNIISLKNWKIYSSMSQLPTNPDESYATTGAKNFERTTSSFPSPYNSDYGFMYRNISAGSYFAYRWEPGLTATGSMMVSSAPGDGNTHLQYTEWRANYGNQMLTYEVEVPQVQEVFIDQNHTEISAADLDNSLVQNNSYYAIQDSYLFGGHGQPSSLPLTYTKNSKTYEYKGWFYGDEFKTGIPQFDWKDIPDDQKDKYGKIRIMYAEKKATYDLTGHWVDDSAQHNLLTNISGTVGPNPGVYPVTEGFNFSGSAHMSIQENGGGPWWDFVGWMDPIHSPGIINPSNNVVLNNVDCDTDFYYIYRKRAPRMKLELSPSSTVVTESGKTINWTLTINNTGGDTLKNIKLSNSFVAASGGNMTSPVNTVVKNHSGVTISGLTDASWTDNGAEFAAKNVSVLKDQKLTINFQTTVTGDIHESIDHNVKVDGNVDNQAEVTSNIRIKDPDHHDITDPANEELSLLYAPNKFDFGFHEKKNNGIMQTVSLKQNQYNNKTINKGFYVKIQDPRENLAGNTWKLTASLSYFVDSSSIILLTQPTIDLGNFSAETATDANTGTESFSSTSNATVTPGTISLVGGGGTIPVMNSQNLKNKGTWLLRIPFNDVKLHIPADVGEEGKGYTSELTWTLNDTI